MKLRELRAAYRLWKSAQKRLRGFVLRHPEEPFPTFWLLSENDVFVLMQRCFEGTDPNVAFMEYYASPAVRERVEVWP